MSLPSADLLTVPSFLAKVTIEAENLPGLGEFITNSVFVAAIVVVTLLYLAKKATRRIERVPSGHQNFFEFIVEFLYNQVENIVGPKVAPRAFPLLATLFLFIVTANWFGLFPGVGTIGFAPSPEERAGPITLDAKAHNIPLLRPATADLNMTLGMALTFMVIWWIITMREVGIIGFFKHVFAPKGGLTGVLAALRMPIFFFVGVIELISREDASRVARKDLQNLHGLGFDMHLAVGACQQVPGRIGLPVPKLKAVVAPVFHL